MLIRQFEVGNMSIFSYLIGDELAKECLFIDPADEHDTLLAEAESKGLTIKYIVNTHSHIDHVMGNKEMVRRTGAKIVIHEADAPGLADTPQNLLDMFGAEPSPPADILVSDGDVIKVGNIGLKVIHTPGHTPGGMCLGAWGAVFPYVMTLDLDGGFSWETDPSKIKIHCADPIGITLLVERIKIEKL